MLKERGEQPQPVQHDTPNNIDASLAEPIQIPDILLRLKALRQKPTRSNTQIAQALGISKATLYLHINNPLISQGINSRSWRRGLKLNTFGQNTGDTNVVMQLSSETPRPPAITPFERRLVELREPSLDLTNREIAAELRCCPETLYPHLKRLNSLGLTTRRLPNDRPHVLKRITEREEKILQLRSEHPEITNEQTEEMLGVCHSTMQRDIKRLIGQGRTPKYSGHKYGTTTYAILEKLVEDLRNKGKTNKEIAAAAGRSQPTIIRYVNKLIKEGKVESRSNKRRP